MKRETLILNLSLILILVFLLSGCAKPTPPPVGNVVVLEGPKELPKWVYNPQGENISSTQKAFVGFSRKHQTINDAISEAELDAKLQAVNYIYGTYILEKGKRVLVEAGLTEDVLTGETAKKVINEWQTKGIVVGNRVDVIWQKVRETLETGKTITYYRAFVRYGVDIKTVQDFMKELLTQVKEEQREKEARDKIERGLELIDKLFSEW